MVVRLNPLQPKRIKRAVAAGMTSPTALFAPLVKLVDTPDLGSGTVRYESSSLSWSTMTKTIFYERTS
jgi:hypothetical protein